MAVTQCASFTYTPMTSANEKGRSRSCYIMFPTMDCYVIHQISCTFILIQIEAVWQAACWILFCQSGRAKKRTMAASLDRETSLFFQLRVLPLLAYPTKSQLTSHIQLKPLGPTRLSRIVFIGPKNKFLHASLRWGLDNTHSCLRGVVCWHSVLCDDTFLLSRQSYNTNVRISVSGEFLSLEMHSAPSFPKRDPSLVYRLCNVTEW